MDLKPLLLAGGLSSRMGSRKELLRFQNNELTCLHLLKLLRDACPESNAVYLSLRHPSAVEELIQHGGEAFQMAGDDTLLVTGTRPLTVRLIFDNERRPTLNDEQEPTDVGPASGLMAAYSTDPTATWLVVACDFPLLSPETLRQLREEFLDPVTCFRNQEGFCEPLLGIWSPQALKKLEENVKQGNSGPSSVVRRLQAKTICAHDEQWLFNANTKEEWDIALKLKAKIST